MLKVRTERLSVHYGHTQALSDLSLELEPGITGLLGPNGAGKSTLIRCLATAQIPSSGTIELDGRIIDASSELIDIRKRIGYLPQNPGFYPHFRVVDYLNHFALLKMITGRAERRRHVDDALRAVDLQEHGHDRVRTLSGGMKQRLALACALLGGPQLLILDEPTVGLDPEQRVRFREVITRASENATVILSTHQTDDVVALCQRVLVILGGRVLFDGSPRDLVARASGHVWLADWQEASAIACWMTGEGHYRNVGRPPVGAELVEPTVDDGYLIVTHQALDGSRL